MLNYVSTLLFLFLAFHSYASDYNQPLNLAPEQARALKRFYSIMGEDSSLWSLQNIEFESLPRNEKELANFSQGKLVNEKVFTATLFQSKYWLWNQSRGKIKFTDVNGWKITFRKLNTRIKGGFAKGLLAKHKLWVFNISPKLGSKFSFLWLEKYDDANKDHDYGFVFDETRDAHFASLLERLNNSL